MSGRAWIAFISLGLIWGVPYFFIKLAVQELSPFVVACSRLLLASAILLPIAWRRGALRSVGTHLVPICAFAVVEFVIPFSAISLGEQWISSSATAILIAMVPLTVVLISRFFGLHERLGPWRAAGLARRRVAGEHHHLHQSGRGHAPGRAGAAGAPGPGRPAGLRAHSARLLAGDPEKRACRRAMPMKLR